MIFYWTVLKIRTVFCARQPTHFIFIRQKKNLMCKFYLLGRYTNSQFVTETLSTNQNERYSNKMSSKQVFLALETENPENFVRDCCVSVKPQPFIKKLFMCACF